MRVMKTLILIVLGLVAVSAAGMAFVIQNDTMVEWWLPTVICAMLAISVGYALRRPFGLILPTDNRLLAGTVGAVVAYSILIGAFYALNYYMSDSATSRQFKVAITGKTTEEHYRVRRVGRNRVGRGEKYYTHSVTVEWPDGRLKKLAVAVGEYNKLRTGDSISLTTEDGLLGLPVIKDKKYTSKTKRKIH